MEGSCDADPQPSGQAEVACWPRSLHTGEAGPGRRDACGATSGCMKPVERADGGAERGNVGGAMEGAVGSSLAAHGRHVHGHVGVAAGRQCELCGGRAVAYCISDKAALCVTCDEKVHAANFIASWHLRTLLCSACGGPTSWHAAGAAAFGGIQVAHLRNDAESSAAAQAGLLSHDRALRWLGIVDAAGLGKAGGACGEAMPEPSRRHPWCNGCYRRHAAARQLAVRHRRQLYEAMAAEAAAAVEAGAGVHEGGRVSEVGDDGSCVTGEWRHPAVGRRGEGGMDESGSGAAVESASSSSVQHDASEEGAVNKDGGHDDADSRHRRSPCSAQKGEVTRHNMHKRKEVDGVVPEGLEEGSSESSFQDDPRGRRRSCRRRV